MAEVGRPPLFEKAEELEALADAYFASCEAEGKRPTVNGLTLALGMSSRQSLFDYAKKDGFIDAVKKARTRLEAAWEEGLVGANAAGTIFWLKNQGWFDTQRTELSGVDGGPIQHEANITLEPGDAYRRLLDAGLG